MLPMGATDFVCTKVSCNQICIDCVLGARQNSANNVCSLAGLFWNNWTLSIVNILTGTRADTVLLGLFHWKG